MYYTGPRILIKVKYMKFCRCLGFSLQDMFAFGNSFSYELMQLSPVEKNCLKKNMVRKEILLH